ncbi:MAG: diguanylate cyclase [Nitrospirae bacterium]|nr:diguanylate cyclase [Nitrospirota bacterium]
MKSADNYTHTDGTIERLQKRIQELEMSLQLYQEESIRRRDILETSREYLQTVIDNIGDPMIVIDTGFHVVLANKKLREKAGGIDPVKEDLHCYDVTRLCKMPCPRQKNTCQLKKMLKKKSQVNMTRVHTDGNGGKRYVDIVAAPILDNSGNIVYIIESCRDITERMEMEEALRGSETRYRSLFEHSCDAIYIVEAEGEEAGRILSANQAACEMHGYSGKELRRLSITDLNDTQESASKALRRIKRILDGENLRVEATHKKKDGTVFPVEASASLMKAGDKKYVLIIYRDISQRRQAEEERERLLKELEQKSQIDGLTGLLNRQYLDKRIKEEMKRAKRYGNPLTMIMFDIDNFKKINDSYGHIAGDKIVQTTADVIREALRDTDVAGRFGGDEFIILLTETDMDTGAKVAERIRRKIEKADIPNKKNQVINFTISLGICRYDDKVKTVEDFIAKADKALYTAKSLGNNRVCKIEE